MKKKFFLLALFCLMFQLFFFSSLISANAQDSDLLGIYNNYFQALTNKDVGYIKSIVSKQQLEIAEKSGKTWEEIIEILNTYKAKEYKKDKEEIKGNSAILYLTGKVPDLFDLNKLENGWAKVFFVKEGGTWKLDTEKWRYEPFDKWEDNTN